MIFLTFIWNINPEIFRIGGLAPRYYGLLFALGFIIGYKIMTWVYKREGLDILKVDNLTMWMVLSTVIGARLGHCLFYEPAEYLKQPWRILFIWEGGLASHGAAFAILGAIWFYSKKYKDQPVLWLLDRLVITIALAGCFIRMGNFFNSEILGKQTDAPTGIVFARSVTENIEALNMQLNQMNGSHNVIKSIKYELTGSKVEKPELAYETNILVDFDGNYSKEDLNDFMMNLPDRIRSVDEFGDKIDHIKLGDEITSPQIINNGNQTIVSFKALAIPRHPSQLYESFSCILLFGLLFLIYLKFGSETPRGLLLGLFMIVCFGLRFLWEYLKENQVAFEDQMTYNMGQMLSIPLIITGIILVIRSFVLKNKPNKGEIF
ncbi:MAG: prolipoprotein diacylglyceryl transferase [Cytophagales bacterium]